MKTIVAAFHPELPRDLQQGILHRKDLRLVPVRSLQGLLERLPRSADLFLLGPQLGEHGAVSVAQAVRASRKSPSAAIVLVMNAGTALGSGAQAQFDEVIEWPAKPAELSAVLGRLLNLPARQSERYPLRLHVFSGTTGAHATVGPRSTGAIAATGPAAVTGANSTTRSSPETYLGATVDLSTDGMLLRTGRTVGLGDRLSLRFALPGRPELRVAGRVLRIDTQSHAPDSAVALRFEAIGDAERLALKEYFLSLSGGRLFRWNITREGERVNIQLSGVLSADVELSALKHLRGDLHFNMREFRRISSDSIQSWIDLIRALVSASAASATGGVGSAANTTRITLHECPVAFIQQANAISNLLDSTAVASFYAPYLCTRCGLDEEQLVDVQQALAARGSVENVRHGPPTFRCVRCAADMVLDDIPERYFMFL